MIIYSQSYPGLHLICTNCGCLFGFSVQEIYEDKYVYCPICREKLDSGVREGAWWLSRKEETPNEKTNTDSANNASQ